ncbi:hypothetical protein PF002_g1977 [Phytophthora fragariae]|uniref:Uncharacterized protein n=1 Tax=Phytophthora fragariae TaxID=53985 RepID=A0A6A4EH69_9STRA|nr:hypothetical protein PF003_g5319 [Phytophthora fragariae]KAE8945692.1 hypothetical protein PF009_g4656 [Phytophthora fragariae]KAE9151436.1 hypothetical protein PF006_g4267 [Phytophthora fragariae]KAE9256237.1 hypothetical protein PF002_g1977 [Phytophthora fragariae]KAE9322306.1 hypothetical protein PF001_g4464 [Phytophthora fragariae]
MHRILLASPSRSHIRHADFRDSLWFNQSDDLVLGFLELTWQQLRLRVRAAFCSAFDSPHTKKVGKPRRNVEGVTISERL